MKSGFVSAHVVLFVTGGLASAQGLGTPRAATPADLDSSVIAKIGAPVSPAIPATPAVPAAPANSENLSSAWSASGSSGNKSFWFSAEYLLWWTRSEGVPPLVGALPGSLARIPATSAEIAALRSPDLIISPDRIGFGATSGMRLGGGFWLDPQNTVGLDASYFGLEHRAVDQRYQSNGDPVIGPAYFAPLLNEPLLIENAIPGIRSGFVATGFTQQLWGLEANARLPGVTFLADRTDFLIGFRHLQLSEGITVVGSSTLLPGTVGAGNTDTTFDRFGTHNQFYGPQVGIDNDYRWGRWSMNMQAKLALGAMHEATDVQGATTFVTAGVPATIPGGVLALPTNMGHYSRDIVSVIPELTLKTGYQVNCNVRLFVAYNILYVNNVLRPGQQIDTNVNTFQIPSLQSFNPMTPATRPVFQYSGQSFWAQGINFGVEITY